MTDFFKYSGFSVWGRAAAKLSIPEYIAECSGPDYDKYVQEIKERIGKENVVQDNELSL